MDPQFKKWLEDNELTDAYVAASDTGKDRLRAAYAAEHPPEDDPPADPPDDFQQLITARRGEQQRRREITEVVDRETELYPGRIDDIQAMAEAALEAGTSSREFRYELIDARPVGPPNVPSGRSSGQTADVLEAAVAKSLGGKVEEHYSDEVLSAADREFPHGVGLQQLLFRAAAQYGQHYDSAANVRGLLAAAFGRSPDGAVLQAAGGFSTFSLPGIFADVLNKGLADYFTSVEQVYSRLSSTRFTRDYKQVKNYALTGDLEYAEIPPGGQIPHGTLGEETYSNQAKNYGRMLAITHEDIVNDDLGALETVRMRMGRGGALALNRVFWTAFMDNGSFFSAGNDNFVDGADTDLSGSDPGAALNGAEAAFRKQTDPDGLPMSVMPRILLVPPDLANYAAQLMGAQRIVTGAASTLPDANVYSGRYRVESSVYLSNTAFTGNSELAWYLLADPMDVPVIQIVYLNGRQMPLVESAEADFDELGIRVRGTWAFGVAKQEHRGGVKAKGEA